MEKEELEVINKNLHVLFDLLFDIDSDKSLGQKFASRSKSAIAVIKDLSIRINRIGEAKNAKESLLSSDGGCNQMFETRLEELVLQINSLMIERDKLSELLSQSRHTVSELQEKLKEKIGESSKNQIEVENLRGKLADLNRNFEDLRRKARNAERNGEVCADFLLRAQNEEQAAELVELRRKTDLVGKFMPTVLGLFVKIGAEATAQSSDFEPQNAQNFLVRLGGHLDAFCLLFRKVAAFCGESLEEKEFTLNPHNEDHKIDSLVQVYRDFDFFGLLKNQARLIEKLKSECRDE